MQMVAPGGSVVVVGLADQPVSVVPLRLVRRGLHLIGSLIYDHPRDFQCAIDLVEQGLIHPGAARPHHCGPFASTGCAFSDRARRGR